jgi:hypothetical protein
LTIRRRTGTLRSRTYTRLMRRLWRVAAFAFGPLRRTSGIATWWPVVLTAVSAVAAGLGIAMPKRVGGDWLAIAGLAGLSVVLFLAVYRLHRIAFPDFPAHRFTNGPLWVLASQDPRRPEEKLIVFDVDFTNRDPHARVHLTVDLWWIHDFKVSVRRRFGLGEKLEPLGPYQFWPRQDAVRPIGALERPTDVGPHGRTSGTVAFDEGVVPGLEVGDDASELRRDPNLRLFVRLTDDVSGAECDIDVNVPTQS